MSVWCRRRSRRRRTIPDPHRTPQAIGFSITCTRTAPCTSLSICLTIAVTMMRLTPPHTLKRPPLPRHPPLIQRPTPRRTRLQKTPIPPPNLSHHPSTNTHLPTRTQSPTPNKKHEPQTKQQQRTLHNSHPLLPHQLLSKHTQPPPQLGHLAPLPLPHIFQLNHSALPKLIVQIPKGPQLHHHGAVKVVQELLRLGQLALFHFEKGVAQGAGLLFNVLQGEGAVGFEVQEPLVDGFEEGFLG